MPVSLASAKGLERDKSCLPSNRLTDRNKQSFTIGVIIISERDTGCEKESLAFLSIGRLRNNFLGQMISR